MTKLEAPETPPPGTDARCTQLFGGGGGATESPPHASRHRKPRSASRGVTRIDSGRQRSRKRCRAVRKVKSSRPKNTFATFGTSPIRPIERRSGGAFHEGRT